MNKTTAFAGLVLALAGATSAFAQDTLPDNGTDAARQARMNEAYRNHQEGPVARAEDATKRGFHKAGQAIHHGAVATGAAIHHGAVATGHAVRRGANATSRALHRSAHPTAHPAHPGTDKVTGHP